MTTEMVEVPAGVAADGEYLLKMRGDSMTDAAILDGDFLVVKDADTATDGEIVIAMVGAEATVKRWRVDPDGSVWLESANATMEPIRAVELERTA